MSASIKFISSYLPTKKLTNEAISQEFPEWSVEKISAKTGIRERSIAATDETTSSLAINASRNLLTKYNVDPSTIDFIVLCTQTPDYFLPTTACLVQTELGLSVDTGAFDINLGCSGYVYGVNIAKGLICSGDATNVLLITADTYSKCLRPDDKSVRTIFGDGATATLITETEDNNILKGQFGTDGRGAKNLILETGAFKEPNKKGNDKDDFLFMNGAEIFIFTLKAVPNLVQKTLIKNELDIDDIDLFIFHQANKFMLDSLRKKIKIPKEKFFVDLEKTGNTVSSSIPLALQKAIEIGKAKKGSTIMIVGFGVGYSWGANIIKL